MSRLWCCLEDLAGGAHVAAVWAGLSGEQFPPLRAAYLRDTGRRARFVPCPHGCSCEHEVVERANGKLAGVCRCEPWGCEDFEVTPADTVLMEANVSKLGRDVCRAFDGSPKETELSVPGARQIGSFG